MSDEHIRSLERAVQENDSAETRVALAEALARLGRAPEALAALEPIVSAASCPPDVKRLDARLREALAPRREPCSRCGGTGLITDPELMSSRYGGFFDDTPEACGCGGTTDEIEGDPDYSEWLGGP